MLTAYDGTVIFVSHDRFFIDRVAIRVWDIANEGLSQYLGNFTDAARQRSKLMQQSHRCSGQRLLPSRRYPRTTAHTAIRTGERVRLQKQLASAERDISRLEARLNDLSDAIAIAGVDGLRERLEVLGVEYAEAERQLDGAYQLWEELNGELESLVVAAAAG